MVSLWKADFMKYCWRLIRSRSPRGRPSRWRTKARACVPEMTESPAGRLMPELDSFWAVHSTTGTPWIALLMR